MAQYRTVTEFLIKIREAYQNAREDYSSVADAITNHENNYKKEMSRGWSDPAERQKFIAKSEETKKNLKNKLNGIINDAKLKFKEISTECDSVFERHYRPTADDVDVRVLELLKSDICTLQELKALAGDFENNAAMRRIIGSKIVEEGQKAGNYEAQSYGLRLTAKSDDYRRPYREPIDSLIYFSEQALREDIGLSDAIAQNWEKKYESCINSAEGINILVSG